MNILIWQAVAKAILKRIITIVVYIRASFDHTESLDWFSASAGEACFPPWSMRPQGKHNPRFKPEGRLCPEVAENQPPVGQISPSARLPSGLSRGLSSFSDTGIAVRSSPR